LGYYVGTTQVIQGSTRNLVNIGTISSGAITSSGTITTSGSFVGVTAIVDNVLAKTSNGNILFKTNGGASIARFNNDLSANFFGTISSGAITSSGTGQFTFMGLGVAPNSANYLLINRVTGNPNIKSSDAYLLMDSSGGMAGLNWYSSDRVVLANGGGNVGIGSSGIHAQKLYVAGDVRATSSIRADGGFLVSGTTRINSVGDGLFTSLYIGSTNIVDTSRNLTNIGTISSGAIQIQSSSGSLNALDLGSSTQTGFTNIIWRTNSGNAQIWKQGSSADSYGGASALNIYNSNGLIAFHPSGTANVAQIDSGGLVLNNTKTVEFKDDNGVVRGTINARSSAPHFRIATSGNESIGFYDSTTENIRINGSGDLNLITGNLEISGTTVIDSSRNLTNIGTITSSGQFTTAGSITAGNASTVLGYYVGTTQVIQGSTRNLVNIGTISSGAITSSSYIRAQNYYGQTNSSVAYHGYGDTSIMTGVNGATYLYAGASTTVALTLQAGRTIAPILAIGQVNAYTDVIDSSRNLKNIPTISTTDGGNIKLFTSSATSGGQLHVPRAGHISFYGDTSNHHAIMSRNNVGVEADDIRINSYADVWINLDSNNNNTSNANFYIGRHGGGIGSIDLLLSVDGEDGDLITEGNVTAYGSPSDIRLKENVERIADPIDKVKQLDGITFNYKKGGTRSTGLIAQQLLEVLPEVVYETEDLHTGDTHYAVRYGQVVGLLVEAVKELTQRIEELENGNHKDD
jgi:hypothetical protein